MSIKKLEVMPTLTEAVGLGIKNVLPLLCTVVLYIITVWIPWLNVGTTVGLYRVVIDLGKGKTINPMSLFDKKNFDNIGNFFLLQGLLSIGISAALMFMFIPGIIMGIAWGYAIYILIDKKVRPIKALALSDKATYGEKWTIFLIDFIVAFVISLVASLLALIPKVGPLFAFLVAIAGSAIAVAVNAVLYRHFSKKVDELIAEEAAAVVETAAIAPKAAKKEEPKVEKEEKPAE